MTLDDYGEGEYGKNEDAAGYENEYLALTLGFNYAF